MFEFIVEAIAEWIAGGENASRWTYITALFGWAAAVALTGWLIAMVFGFSHEASAWVGVFSSLLGITLSLDLKRVRK